MRARRRVIHRPRPSWARGDPTPDGRRPSDWVLGKAWRLGILRYGDDGRPYWHGETHLDGEDRPFADFVHDHVRGVTLS